MANIIISPATGKYIKKLKDKNLKELFKEAFDEIKADPTVGEEKHGDLEGILSYGFRYNRTEYRVAYTVEYVNDELVVVILAGTHENFYREVKKYWNK
ncbi:MULTISPECIES: type II toxin-antitoxin system RelE/ParE family toxin [Butyrivibrio]|uniref:type II toxin-antitoxin system RelE/ParE family toxin n=1 Tax=Butyrivibrio TaxID=830 RepID=UPI0004176E57|nr:MULTISPECIES: type II toxin-antitoxin system RelE/ParE family toxin [Butyrivibrio]SFU46528.1 mRNA-degrading endonuclease RelE, toxin component of the RelBE toxin-antitoxin system [Butyrivibrio sp. M55]